ncbi:MAG: hypothetical protein JWL64_1442 [Frankiales bacterium]|nr:hypothetical protein [Frankiales bacterium]
MTESASLPGSSVIPRELDHPAIDAVLSAAAAVLGMEVVFIGGLTEELFVLEKVRTVGEPFLPPAGSSIPRTDSFCHRMLSGAPPATSDAPSDPYYAGAAHSLGAPLTSYVGVPVTDRAGRVVATLCGIDRGEVIVDGNTLEVLRQLAEVVAAHLGPDQQPGLVIRRSAGGGWQVSGEHAPDDLTSAMVLADLLANDLAPQTRPRRPETPPDELGQLRLSVTQLEHALAARVVVEQAIGVLTERQRHTPREAFERLRKVARARGRKVHDLAREVVLSSTDPTVPLPPELAGKR